MLDAGYFCVVVVVVDEALPDGAIVVLDDVVDGGVAGAVVVVELELVPDGLVLGAVVVVVADEAGGVVGTTTVVELVAGGVDDVVEVGWQAPSASSTLAATAV